MPLRQVVGFGGVIAEQLEIGKVEAWAHRAPHQRVGPHGSRCLPRVGCHDVGGVSLGREGAQLMACGKFEFGISREEFEGVSFIMVPSLVRGDSVPAADTTLGQEEIDGG